MSKHCAHQGCPAVLFTTPEQEPPSRTIFPSGDRGNVPWLDQCSRWAYSVVRRSPCTAERHRPSTDRADADTVARASLPRLASLSPVPLEGGQRREGLPCHRPSGTRRPSPKPRPVG